MNYFLLILSVVLMSKEAFATASLKQVQMANESQINLLFDKSFDKKNFKLEFFKDIIQLSLSDTLVYPAKISSVNSGALTKIFAYQYSPKLVRCRFTVKGEAEKYKNQIQVSPSGKMLTIRINPIESDQVVIRASQAVAAPIEKKEIIQSEDKALLEKMSTLPPAVQEEPKNNSLTGRKNNAEPMKIEKHNPLLSFWKVFLLAGVIAFFAWVMKKNRFKINNTVQKIAKKKFGKDTKLVEVLTTHYLGPNKSIAVIRVTGKLFVIGITNESINLITQIHEDDEVFSEVDQSVGAVSGTGTGAVADRSSGFSHVLSSESQKPVSNVKAQIRSKLEGMKSL